MNSLIVVVLLAAQSNQPFELNDANYFQWRDYLRPKSSELEWQALPWHISLSSAVYEANQQDKPVLLWAMNGHPFAAT